jgi:hypothetical protein
MDIQKIQRKLSDNRSRKFRRLYIYKSEILNMKTQGFSIRQIQTQLYRDHQLKVSIGSLHSFIVKFFTDR